MSEYDFSRGFDGPDVRWITEPLSLSFQVVLCVPALPEFVFSATTTI